MNRREKIAIGGSLTVVVVAAVFSLLYPPFEGWLLKWQNALSGALSAVLTLALVILYWRQHDVLKADQRPILEVEDYEASSSRDLDVYISNYTDAPATNLELIIGLIVPENSDADCGLIARPLNRIEESQGNNNEQSEGGRKIGRSIRRGESGIKFRGRMSIPKFHPTDNEVSSGNLLSTISHGWGLQSGMERLVEEEVELVRIHLWIRYEDVLGNYHSRHFCHIEKHPGDNTTVESLLMNKGMSLGGRARLDADSLELDLSDADRSGDSKFV
jgi:hypothetical protein